MAKTYTYRRIVLHHIADNVEQEVVLTDYCEFIDCGKIYRTLRTNKTIYWEVETDLVTPEEANNFYLALIKAGWEVTVNTILTK